MTDNLLGRRVLIVEDEMLIAMLMEDMLVDLGCKPVGPAGDIQSALRLAVEEAVDVAILDVNLNGKSSYPVADALAARAIPFIFATGYGANGLSDRYSHFPTLQKPFQQRDLAEVLRQTLSGE